MFTARFFRGKKKQLAPPLQSDPIDCFCGTRFLGPKTETRCDNCRIWGGKDSQALVLAVRSDDNSFKVVFYEALREIRFVHYQFVEGRWDQFGVDRFMTVAGHEAIQTEFINQVKSEGYVIVKVRHPEPDPGEQLETMAV